jgi:hypothetical protein
MTKEITKHYNGTIELCFDKAKHHYTIDGKTIDGVTSVLQVIAKPALIYWSANKAAEYVDKYLEVGQVIDELTKKKLVDGAKTAHRTLKEDAGNIGTMLHELIEKFIKGEKYQEPVNDMLKKSFEQFKSWVKDNEVEFKSSERKVVSLKYGFCGTLDATAVIKGKNVIVDIKTSSGIWDEYWLQTAAYKEALQEEFPDLPVDHTIIIRCGKDGAFEIKEMNNFEQNLQGFLGALALHRCLKQLKFQNYDSNKNK